ncbi:MAG TPA: GWxTD domain-containing protein [Bacteroidota bacterium]|nr:GWxTD domain-containing protein [Bacteroidota bacterium]
MNPNVKRVQRFFGWVLLCQALVVPLAGQVIPPRAPFFMNLDYARFRNDSTSTYLEIYYSFYGGSIGYTFDGTVFRGNIFTTTIFRRNSDGDTVLVQNRRLPINLADTSAASLHTNFVLQTGGAFRNGDYRLLVFSSDSLFPGQRDSIELPVSLQQYPSSLAVSDIELCSEIKSSPESKSAFYKNTLEVVPNPTLVFGVGMHPVVFRYVELYNLDTSATYAIEGAVIDPQTGAVVRKEGKTRRFRVRDAVDVGLQNVSSIHSGKYVYRVTVSDTSQHELCRSEKVFYLNNPQIKNDKVSSTQVTSTMLAGLTADELRSEFKKAKYLASSGEIKSFDELQTAEGMRNFLGKFWASVEAGRPPISDGITRTAYLHRIEVATQRFRAMGRDGWQTDRGRAYVLYGEPDDIERYPSTQGQKPYEVWHYYKIESGVEFDFVDRSGFGDYILVNSTKRGELQDDQWQRYLQ